MAIDKHQFILWAPYKTGPDFAARYKAHFDAHIAGGTKLVAAGVMKLAGPAFAPTADLSLPWAERETVASVAVYEAEGLESARKIVEADPFYSGGVWDIEKVQLNPILNIVQ
ncbi:hypothetical protein FOMPIDRAFT_1023601 [Fomitopsis schrenkii]|uniref:YCII-related domain-containing protein n=1 Tax=Fomitopsis schrenkii TaxID=2126942 RepID=S8FRI1_FOMSC|nr:hypothetical protein FOMPIDRAFT_1023601 [Fomitopsis schrenkii]